MIFQIDTEIIWNNNIAPDIYHMKLYAPEIAYHAHPGQFIHIRCQNNITPLLRRPMSIFDAKKEWIEILYYVRGIGTSLLAQRKKGEKINIIGPLGHGFNISHHHNIWLVAGGMGISPLYFLAQKLKSENKSILLFLGINNISDLNITKLINNIENIKISTNDGSYGFKGYITELVEEYLNNNYDCIGTQTLKIYTCGPKPMLIKMQQLSERYNILCELSLEAYMGCGVGACLSCVCKTRKENYKKVCTDGPVFNANEVIIE